MPKRVPSIGSQQFIQVAGLDLLRTVGYELKSPLTHIASAASMLADGDIPSEGRVEHYKQMEESSRRMLHIVDSVLFAGQVATNQLMLNLEPTNVASVTTTVIANLKQLAAAYNKTLKLQVSAQLSPAAVDRAALNYSLYGLVEMLIRSSDSKVIEILIHNQTDSVMITLRDQGPAFSNMQLSRVLSRIGKARQPVKQLPSTNGMALFVALSLTKAMQGDITMKQQASKRLLSLKLPLSQQLELV